MENIGALNIILLIFLFVLLSGFFSLAEAALLSTQRVRLRAMAVSGSKGAQLIESMLERPERFLSTILLGNNLANSAAASLTTAVAISLFNEGIGILIATMAVTVVLLLFSEITPKAIATQHAERIALVLVRPLQGVALLFRPLVAVLEWVVIGVTSVAGRPQRGLLSEEEIRSAMAAGVEAGTVEQQEAEIVANVFRFTDRMVREVMTPRLEIVWVERGATFRDLLAVYKASSHSRFPVYEGDHDNVIGVLSIQDALLALAKGEIDMDRDVTSFVRPPSFVPETKRIGDLYAEMQRRSSQLVLVVDEFGGVAGLVTLDLLAEQVMGPIGEEPDGDAAFTPLGEGSYEIDAGMSIEEVEAKTGLSLPPGQGQYETMAGFVLSLLGHIPHEGESVSYRSMRFTVQQTRGNKIERLLVTEEQP
ncbi:MAG: HlyC/CorC family transporter [Chloroflexi bacterium]|nr:HlyC/CorC family transporter [Chloroflexota bacterium]